MSNKQTITFVLVLLVLLGVAVGLSFVFREETSEEGVGTVEEEYTAGEPLTVVHSFENGVHRFGASVEIPSPCHKVGQSATVMESFPEQIAIDIQIAPPAEGVICAQVISRALVNVEISASKDARLTTVRINGNAIQFEVFEEAKG